MGLQALCAAIDELVGTDPAELSDRGSIECLESQLARLEAVVCAAAVAFEEGGAWAPSGARSAVAWLARHCRLPKAIARRQLRLGRLLRRRRRVREAWLAGQVTSAQAQVIGGLDHGPGAEALDRDEEMLVAQAGRLGFADFARAADYWSQLADPEGTEEAAEARRARRAVSLDQTLGGAWVGALTLDPVAGAVVAGELERLGDELFRADWAQAAEALGRPPTVGELPRTPAQRRADALVEMARRSGTAPEGGRRPAPLFSVFVGYETLRGRILELAQGRVLAPGDLVPWLGEADLERAVFASPRRVEVSATARLFTGATRRGVELRDRRCAHPYCDCPLERCQVDHVVPYAQGGPTTQENGRLLCGFHNRQRHRRPPPDPDPDPS